MNGQNTGRVSWEAMSSVVAAVFLLAATAGCGGGGLPPGNTGTVSGKITYDGKPVPEGAKVVFVNAKYGIVATGQVAADGTYSLMMRGGPKILAGSYNISVNPPVSPQREMSQEEYAKVMTGEAETEPQQRKAVPEIPEKVRTPETSGLTYEVKAGDNSGVDFDLNDAGDAKDAKE